VGGYRFVQTEVETLLTRANGEATIVAVPDALLGQRYAGSTTDPDAMRRQLQAHGANPLIAGAFRARTLARSA
jgi:hypothetical protein